MYEGWSKSFEPDVDGHKTVDITSQVTTNHYYLLAQVNIGLTYL